MILPRGHSPRRLRGLTTNTMSSTRRFFRDDNHFRRSIKFGMSSRSQRFQKCVAVIGDRIKNISGMMGIRKIHQKMMRSQGFGRVWIDSDISERPFKRPIKTVTRLESTVGSCKSGRCGHSLFTVDQLHFRLEMLIFGTTCACVVTNCDDPSQDAMENCTLLISRLGSSP